MEQAYKKYTEYMNNETEFIITPTREYFENNTIEEIELVVAKHPNIFDYEYILDQYATDGSIEYFHSFGEAIERLIELDPKNWSESQKVEVEGIVRGDLSTIIYNLEQMDFTAEEILYRLEDCLKGYTFELDTENGDTISLVRGL